jgi:4-hydroxybenzoate polyprenyltransferase
MHRRAAAPVPGSRAKAGSRPYPAAMQFRRNPGYLPALALAAHPFQGLAIAAGTAFAAALAGRSLREVGVVFAAVLLGRLTYGWLNDVADRHRDIAVDRQDKPLAREWLDPGSLTFATAVAVCLLVPVSITTGIVSGIVHLLSVVAMWTYNSRVKTTPLSWVPWAVSFGLLPAYLSYGGWGGDYEGVPPTWQMTVLAAALGVCVHFLDALPDLVVDNRNKLRSLPLVVALRTGAPRLLFLSSAATIATVSGLVIAGATVGLAQ